MCYCEGDMITIQFSALPERLRNKIYIEPNSGCWLWVGCADAKGYGQMCRHVLKQPKAYRVHRYVYEFFNGPILKGLECDHLCKTRCCCNPYHIEPVPHTINVRRGIGNANVRKTHCPQGHPYNGIATSGQRVCHICRSAADKRRKLAKRITTGQTGVVPSV